jgi:hypothetical protein
MIVAALGLAVLAVVPATAAPPKAGWTTYQIPTAGISIDLPSTWAPADFRKLAPQAGSALAVRYPGMAEIAKLALKNKLVKFFAFATNGDPVDITVLRFSSGQLQNKGLAAQMSSALIQEGLKPSQIHEQRVKLPAGVGYRLTVPLLVFTLHLKATEYIFVHNGSAIEIAFAAPAARLARYAPTFLHTARSMQYLSMRIA